MKGFTSKRWVVPDRTESNLIDQLLKNRGITDQLSYFNPDFDRDSHDPMLMPSMHEAIERIQLALSSHEHVTIYADYDADGIPGGAILYKLFIANGGTVSAYIPDRLVEGYGLNIPAIELLKKQGTSLIITVDLGITNKIEVEYAASLGIDVIVTDHHHIDPDRLPTAAVAIVHPSLPNSAYPFKALAGGGVAWKLAQALAAITGVPTKNQLKWWLELVAISTVCDMMPLTGENRAIVHFGLSVLKKTRNQGLAALYQVASIATKSMTSGTIGFQIGPRINASGRMDGSSLAFDLLTTEDQTKVLPLAQAIEIHNQERKALLETIIQEAFAQLDNLSTIPAICIMVGKSWSVGLMGLAASRIVERAHRPAILLTDDGSGVLKGSARSIDGFNILAAIHQERALLTSYGGHERAAGLQLARQDFTKFQSRILAVANRQLQEEDLVPKIKADAKILPIEITPALLECLEQFAPFGMANPEPVFIVEPLTIERIQLLGSTKQHVKFSFADCTWQGIAFRFAAQAENIHVGDAVGVVAVLGWNEWRGTRSIQLVIKDMHRTQDTSTVAPAAHSGTMKAQ